MLFPLAAAAVLLLLKGDKWRGALVSTASVIIGLGAIALLITTFQKEIQYFSASSLFVDKGMFYVELTLAGYIF